MTIHTCPCCGLRFEFRTELEWHLAEDHDREWASTDRTRSHPARSQRAAGRAVR